MCSTVAHRPILTARRQDNRNAPKFASVQRRAPRIGATWAQTLGATFGLELLDAAACWTRTRSQGLWCDFQLVGYDLACDG
jgi:hypothetical protein